MQEDLDGLDNEGEIKKGSVSSQALSFSTEGKLRHEWLCTTVVRHHVFMRTYISTSSAEIIFLRSVSSVLQVCHIFRVQRPGLFVVNLKIQVVQRVELGYAQCAIRLIFVPGWREGSMMRKLLEANSSSSTKFHVHRLHPKVRPITQAKLAQNVGDTL